jgi:hypothetical protein
MIWDVTPYSLVEVKVNFHRNIRLYIPEVSWSTPGIPGFLGFVTSSGIIKSTREHNNVSETGTKLASFLEFTKHRLEQR